jgi:hypothetical protein
MKTLAGVLAMVVGFVVGIWGFVVVVQAQTNLNIPFWESVITTAVGFVIASAGAGVFQVGKRLAARSANQLRSGDNRPPILLLRNFAHDFLKLEKSWSYFGYFAQFVEGKAITLEEMIARRLKRFGPVVAVARPGEKLPPYGFARTWLPDEWKNQVGGLIAESQFIFFVIGDINSLEEGLGWELGEVLRKMDLQRIVFVVPPVEDLSELWRKYVDVSDGVLPDALSPGDCFLTFSGLGQVKRFGGSKRRHKDYERSLRDLIEAKMATLLARSSRAA